MLKGIPDHIQSDLNILFVGFNPSLRSGETGHHFANPNNRFWNILYQSGLTPYKLKPEEDGKLLEYGYGLTNIVQRPTKAAEEITKEEYDEGRCILQEKISRYLPKVVCFVGKGVYLQYAKRRQAHWGHQEDAMINGVVDFVAPSSSGLVRMKMPDIIAIYSELGNIIID
ncbi:TDG/mug DNA glycosylase family protein [Pullulanibacillus pueri]|uniref:Mismatch-specific DNA-glycosylase n=1 Tax=Pullulanibacillus pueri TaxID=1437324 RepID=A0A8J2ZTK3_9BACL|nr:G/U mismatch-specific DNA glycosylase [Pullulanibacillus pueri]MBM7681174.1 TDG/mug DNA glycosylase family protein [Pullulanibacillus pueri]GGH77337.1 mismatch-specific DNA-glycosylase [Pullulanibacillus pueri]